MDPMKELFHEVEQQIKHALDHLHHELKHLRTGRAQLPDYYLVLDPESVAGTWRHWWFGALSSKAPTRVLPVGASAAEVRRQLRRLPAGRPWPAGFAEWLGRLQFEVPDRFTPIGAITVGHRSDDPGLRGSAGRGRRPVEEVVHRGRW